MQARAVLAAKPEGRYVFIKGSPTDPNADFLFSGQLEVLKEAMDSGKVKKVDGDHAALNRVALGTQTVSVWKDARALGAAAAEIAIKLAGGSSFDDIEGAVKFSGGPKGVEMTSVFLKPVPITVDKLGTVIDAGWITKEKVCAGVKAGSVAVCN